MRTPFLCLILWLVVQNFQQIPQATALLKVTDLTCSAFDKNTLEIPTCRLRPIDRQRSTVTIAVVFHRTLTDYKVDGGLQRKYSSWQTFIKSGLIDVCAFLDQPRKYVAPALILNVIKGNLNFTKCPLKRGLVVGLDSFEVNDAKFLHILPLELGTYRLFSNWYSGKKLVANINITATYADYRKSY